MLFRILCFLITLTVVFPATVQAESQTRYTVAVQQNPGFVEKIADGTYVGYEIALWEEIARNLNLSFDFVETKRFPEFLDAVRNGDADFGLGNASIRLDRATKMAFSQPYYVSGTQALVPDAQVTFFAALQTFLSPLVLQVLATYLAFLFLFGNFIWWLEHKKIEDMAKSYFPGVLDGIWYAFRKNWAMQTHLGRLLVMPLWVITLLFTSLISAQIISEFAVYKQKSLLLSGTELEQQLPVGVIRGTTSDDAVTLYYHKEDRVRRFDDNEALLEAFVRDDVAIIVADIPLIRYFAGRAKDQGKASLVYPEKLSEELYGIAINYQVDWRLIRKIDQQIMRLRDNGFLGRLERQWLSGP